MKTVKKVLNHIFIDGLSGMALGLFATLIVGTILGQVGNYLPGTVGVYTVYISGIVKSLMGAGIGVGIASKFKYSPLVTVSAGVVGFIAAFSSSIVAGTFFNESGNMLLSGVGDPLCAFIASFIAVEIGNLVSGKTKLDILLVPVVTIFIGVSVSLMCGPYISYVTTALGELIRFSTAQHPFIMGILISVLMGIFLTLPISSAAIAVIIGLSGIAGGAAVVGCSAQMVGFAVMSYRENGFGGLIAQGVGTSMIQMPNIVKKPILWFPPIIASAILGPISTCVLKMTCDASGAGMGTSGLVGQLVTYSTMVNDGFTPFVTLVEILVMHVIAPAIITLVISEGMRKLKIIKSGDLKLDY